MSHSPGQPPEDPQRTPDVRRVVLPSGKTIEVVYFEDAEPAVRGLPAPRPRAPRELHVCEHCAGELVFPVAWEEDGGAHWRVDLRCPDCEHRVSDRFSQEEVERFDERLEHGTEALVRDLKRLMHANMEADIERFVEALEQDHIAPEDF